MQKNYATNQIESLKVYYKDENGNYDEDSLTSAINQYYGYNSIEEFQAALNLNYLRNKAVEDYAKSKVTDSQIKKYYKNEVVGDREVSHIQIIPDVKDNMTDDEKEAAEEETLATAKSVIASLKKGEKFEDLAKEYSDDDSTKDSGGSLGFINKGDYGSDEFDDEAFSLEIGKYSTTPVKTENGYEIIYVTDVKDKAELDDVKDDIIEELSNQMIEDDATLQITALEELRKDNGVDIVDDEINSDYKNYMNKLYESAKASESSN